MRDVEDAKKARALELLNEGISYRDIAEEVKVGKSTVQDRAKAKDVPCPISKRVGQRDSGDEGHTNGTGSGQTEPIPVFSGD